jgi:hypothetical protein
MLLKITQFENLGNISFGEVGLAIGPNDSAVAAPTNNVSLHLNYSQLGSNSIRIRS